MDSRQRRGVDGCTGEARPRRHGRTVTWSHDQVEAGLPARVTGLEYSDPVLTVFGADWSLTLACPWSGRIGPEDVSWEDDDVEDRAWELVGSELVGVTDGEPSEVDFRFTDAVLHVRPDTDLDPWVLRLPQVIVVGEPDLSGDAR